MRTISIQARLFTCYALLVALLFGVAAYAIFQLAVIDKLAEKINTKWLTGTAALGEMADLLSEIHIAQLYVLLDGAEVTPAQAVAVANNHIDKLKQLKSEYAPLATSAAERSLFASFDTDANAYIAAHRDFVAANKLPQESTADVRLGSLYRGADDAVDALIAENSAGATRDTTTADAINDRALLVLSACSAVGLVLAGWIFVVVRRRISQPLAAITRALSGLAAGATEITVPGADRGDEIGEMAKAFDVFRQNAADLVKAHEATEAAHQRAEALARHDALTGLPNRRVFAEKLDESIAGAGTGEAVYAVLLIDLDRFKPVNDIYGHPVGDAVLCQVAERLKTAIRKDDTVARLGGDEFAVIGLFRGGASPFADGARRLANRIIAAVSVPIIIGDTRIDVGASIGIANCPLDGTDPEGLLHAADVAMYRAKREARGTFRFFEASMDMELRARIALEADLRRAVVSGEIRPHYQPLVVLADNRLSGFEVLARWHHPTRGLLLPSEFIPLAEEIAVIGDLTYTLLRAACLDAAAWPNDLMFSLNVSPTQLKDNLFPTRVLAILSETGFPPARLQLEITETALVSDMETARSILETLQHLGIRIALDDFGTGYSSLYHLRELHLDLIKIDRSFVESTKDDPESGKIINAILGLTKSLGLPTTAEGIEDAETLDRMVADGCDFGQGFYFAAAMPAAEAAAFAREPPGTRVAASA